MDETKPSDDCGAAALVTYITLVEILTHIETFIVTGISKIRTIWVDPCERISTDICTLGLHNRIYHLKKLNFSNTGGTSPHADEHAKTRSSICSPVPMLLEPNIYPDRTSDSRYAQKEKHHSR